MFETVHVAPSAQTSPSHLVPPTLHSLGTRKVPPNLRSQLAFAVRGDSLRRVSMDSGNGRNRVAALKTTIREYGKVGRNANNANNVGRTKSCGECLKRVAAIKTQCEHYELTTAKHSEAWR